MTYQMGTEWADRGVRVNAVSPGFVVTEMTRPMLEAMGMDKWISSRTPMRRLGEVQEVTNAVMFLASDLSQLHHRRRPTGRRGHQCQSMAPSRCRRFITSGIQTRADGADRLMSRFSRDLTGIRL